MFDAIFTRYSDAFHIIVDIFANLIIIITEHKSITIINVLLNTKINLQCYVYLIIGN